MINTDQHNELQETKKIRKELSIKWHPFTRLSRLAIAGHMDEVLATNVWGIPTRKSTMDYPDLKNRSSRQT
jgi:hypothetical protein